MSAEVSVVVPFHNVEPYVDDCLRSIAEQTWRDLEVVLVDDGSTDGSRAIADGWAARDDRFRVLERPHRGVAVARNAGIAASGGRYLFFVDSDDLIAPRAVQQLRTSLEESGSDFAAGHVWRLPLTRPLETSWAHRELFTERRTRTTIREFPLLMRDRTVWNKLWRRSFWDEHRLSFPDMWFEDFPVVLRAHLEADAVDLLPDPIYVWRERGSGDSISQRGVDVANVRDRVVAAEMAADLVDLRGDRELRELVHSHLCDVDVREILQSLPRVAPEDVAAVQALAVRLVHHLDRDLLRLARPQMQRAYAAVEAGDFRAASAWAGFLLDRSYRKLARSLSGSPAACRELAADLTGKARTQADRLRHRSRSARLHALVAEPDRLVVRCHVPLQGAVGRVAAATVTAGPVEAAVDVQRGAGGLDLTAEFDTAALAVLRSPVPVVVSVTAGPVHWEGRITCTPADLVATRRGGVRIQASAPGGGLHLEGLRHAPAVTGASFDEPGLVLRLSVPGATVVIPRSWPAEPRRAAADGDTVAFSLDDLLADDPADNPVARIASRPLSVVRAGSATEALLMDAPDVSLVHAGHAVTVMRGGDGRAYLVHREPAGDSDADRPLVS